MNRLVLLLLISLISGPVDAQKIRFTHSSNIWSMQSLDQAGIFYSGSAIFPIGFGPDTIMAGHSYRRFTANHGGYAGPYAIREDTSSGSLYFRFLTAQVGGAQTDTLERLFFDYNFGLNDTLKMDFGNRRQWHYVSAVDSLLIGGVLHKKWRMKPDSRTVGNGFTTEYTFIEGIGSLGGPGWVVCNLIFERIGQLRCFVNQGIRPTIAPAQGLPVLVYPPTTIGYVQADSFDNNTSCTLKTLSVRNIPAAHGVAISPNPGGADITLHVPESFPSATVYIKDVTGRTILRRVVNGAKTAIGQYLSTPGIYYYFIQDDTNGQRLSGRFIFQ